MMTSMPARLAPWELIAADLACPEPRWRELADVLISPAAAGPAGQPARLAEILEAYPGCAVVAAAGEHGGIWVAARGAGTLTLTVPGPAGCPRLRALACGALVCTWLCAGRPLAALGQVRIRVAAGQQPCAAAGTGYTPTWPCPPCSSGTDSPGR